MNEHYQDNRKQLEEMIDNTILDCHPVSAAEIFSAKKQPAAVLWKKQLIDEEKDEWQYSVVISNANQYMPNDSVIRELFFRNELISYILTGNEVATVNIAQRKRTITTWDDYNDLLLYETLGDDDELIPIYEGETQ